MKIKTIFLFLIFSGLLFSAVPSWVQPGVSVVYEGVSSSVYQGEYYNAVYTVITMEVESVSGDLVTGTTYVGIPSVSYYEDEYPWSCYEEDTCDWEFFVDVLNPTGSITGPFGEGYTIIGSGPHSYGDVYFEHATAMVYINEETGVEYHVTFDSVSGLILAYAEIYPSQETYLYFISINTDLSDYEPPMQPNENPDGFGGEFEQYEGEDQGNGQEGETGEGEEDDGVCLSFVFLLCVFSGFKR